MKAKIKTYELILCALFTALIAVGAFIRFDLFSVPFTLQFLFTTLAGLLLGAKLGAISVFVYIAVGLLGIPVFTAGGGIGYIFNPNFGYIIGFAVGTFATGAIANKTTSPSYLRLLAANFVGLIIVYLGGMVYYYIICNYVINTPHDVMWILVYCCLLPLPGDILICIFSAVLCKRLIPILHKQRKTETI